MYGITKDTKEVSGKMYMPTGINENVTFLGASLESLKEGNAPMLKYLFKDSEGRVLEPIIWPLDPEKSKRNAEKWPKPHMRDDDLRGFKKGNIISPEEKVIIDAENFNSRNLHILNKFVDTETIQKKQENVDSYDSFAKSVLDILEGVDTTKEPVRLKVTLNYKDFADLPAFPPFIELMNVPKEKSRLAIGPKDKLVPDGQNQATETPEGFDNTQDFGDLDDEAGF